MKNIKSTQGKAGIAGLLCLLALTFAGCLKHNNDDYYATPQPAALVSVLNTAPSTGPVDFVMEPNRVNINPIQYGDGLDYFACYIGKRTFDFYAAGTQTLLKSDTLTLRNQHYYSFYLVGTTTKEILKLDDTVKRPASGQAGIRLVNVSPDAGAVDLAIQGGAVLATNKGYKGSSAFVSVAGDKTYTIEIRKTGTTTVLATLSSANIHSDSIYTVWLQGLSASTDDNKLKCGFQQNVYWY
ncbi:uncharacterized protein DUF4397 [Mucilaginibacter yixingensis]|uniref:Uncharacterized protein DUF4397 n=1 Tax=Mucilaginibacter yixingensis TaxID=1295612 RepID=A0A2T5JCA3_9SPHI|nr:DUF4397 domain-containing protein [Mucilaginibacter yixingensis]PTQ99391.1 uncharacterized protein DUF4397 [Mucilaginibacter yixingensis]